MIGRTTSMTMQDPVSDVLRSNAHPLDSVFKPKSVAVIGATDRPGSVGCTLLKNLIGTPFGGVVYPVNPKRDHVLGIRAYQTIGSVPEQVDLAVIITPASTVPGVIRDCADAKVKNAIIISAGFREVGHEGEELERRVMAEARRGGMRIIGPNCLGTMCPVSGLNASFANLMPQAGSVAFISQSGAMITSVLDWSIAQKVGFSAVVSVGAMMDVDFSDFIDYLGNDPATKSIVLYMETIGDARRFLAAAREVALRKPIVVIKGGRTEAAAKAAASHTGSLTGSDHVLDAAFRRAGVLRVDCMEELFEMAEVLSKQPLPKGPNLAIVTNAGGPGVLACDSLARYGGQLAELDQKTIEELNAVLPAAWSHSNPVDILGDATAEIYAKALEIVAKDPNCDGMLVILTPQAMTAPTQCAEALKKHANIEGKPVLASWMGGPDVQGGIEVLNRANISTYAYPDMATRAFNYMHEYKTNLKGLYERISLHPEGETSVQGRDRAISLIESIRAEGRTLMTEAESKELLRAYNIPVTACEVATTADGAAAAAERIGFPVVIKLHSRTITHKTDVGGVKLNLRDGAAVKAAFNEMQESVSRLASAEGFEGVTVQPMISLKGYEIILGSSLDVQFGPVMLFGMGGQLVEVFKDSSVGLPPLNRNLAKRMLEQTKIYKALCGVRGMKSVDIDELQSIMVRFSCMLVDLPWIKECDINPLIASPDGILALDSRVLLHDPSVPFDQLPQPAIRPYPSQYVCTRMLRDNTEVQIRPIVPEDEELLEDFYSGVSDETVHRRYGRSLTREHMQTRSHLMRTCFADYERDIVLVAVAEAAGGGSKIAAAGRITKEHMTKDCTFALLVADGCQGKGLGTQLLQALVDTAKGEKASLLKASVLADNKGAIKLLTANGFEVGEEDKATRLMNVSLKL